MIDGEAVVLARRPGAHRAPSGEPPGAAGNDNGPPKTAVRPPRPETAADLVFPGSVRWPAHSAQESRGARDAFAVVGGAKRGGVFATALAVLALGTGVLLLGWQAVPGSAGPAAFALAEARGSVVPHRNGAVLVAEGRIRNVSTAVSAVPPVAISLDGDVRFTRSFQPARIDLAPGASIFFRSTLALPSATNGAIGIALVEAGEGTP